MNFLPFLCTRCIICRYSNWIDLIFEKKQKGRIKSDHVGMNREDVERFNEVDQ